MTSLNFKKEAKLYVVYSGLQYSIDIEEISFSQTFTEQSYPVRTLHSQNSFFEGSVINKANPANFSIRIPFLYENDLDVLLDRAIDTNTFDLYVQTSANTFRIQTCVVTSCNFVMRNKSYMALEIEGEATRVTNPDTPPPGVVQPRAGSRNFVTPKEVTVAIGGLDRSTEITSLSVELQNEVSWTPYTTVQNALTATDSNSSMYPQSFTLKGKTLAGSIQRYVSENTDADLYDWSTGTSLYIKVGQTDGGFRGIDFNLPSVSLTNRLNTGQLFTQSYDWRLTHNSTPLSSMINAYTV